MLKQYPNPADTIEEHDYELAQADLPPYSCMYPIPPGFFKKTARRAEDATQPDEGLRLAS